MKKFFVICVCVFIVIGISNMSSYAAEKTQVEGLENIDAAGNKVMEVFRTIGFWLISAKCFMDILNLAIHGTSQKDIGKTIFTYVLIYGSLFFVPWALRLVEGIF